jgi:hypothetical protein
MKRIALTMLVTINLVVFLFPYPGDGHMLTIGPTRSGKSRRLFQ